jgi:hypothetical protein
MPSGGLTCEILHPEPTLHRDKATNTYPYTGDWSVTFGFRDLSR